MFGMKPTIESLESKAAETASALELASNAVEEAAQTDAVTATDATLAVLTASRVNLERCRRRNDSAQVALSEARSVRAATELQTKREECDRLYAVLRDPTARLAAECKELVELDEQLFLLIAKFEAKRQEHIADLQSWIALSRQLGTYDSNEQVGFSTMSVQGHASRALGVARQARRQQAGAAAKDIPHEPEIWLRASMPQSMAVAPAI